MKKKLCFYLKNDDQMFDHLVLTIIGIKYIPERPDPTHQVNINQHQNHPKKKWSLTS